MRSVWSFARAARLPPARGRRRRRVILLGEKSETSAPPPTGPRGRRPPPPPHSVARAPSRTRRPAVSLASRPPPRSSPRSGLARAPPPAAAAARVVFDRSFFRVDVDRSRVVMAQDGCQPMERFSFAKNGSAQKSWASCPSSRNDAYPAGGGGGGGGGPAGGSYATRPYSVSGYVNGYNPSLPAYPPTRAQIEAAAKRGGGGGGAPARAGGGYSGEIADQMSAQIRFEQRRGGGGGPTMPPPPGQDFSKLSETSGGLTYGGHGAWDGPAPRGDPTKPAPGTPYYVRAPPRARARPEQGGARRQARRRGRPRATPRPGLRRRARRDRNPSRVPPHQVRRERRSASSRGRGRDRCGRAGRRARRAVRLREAVAVGRRERRRRRGDGGDSRVAEDSKARPPVHRVAHRRRRDARADVERARGARRVREDDCDRPRERVRARRGVRL